MRASYRFPADWTAESGYFGFRVASVVPEPSLLLLAALAGVGLFWRRRGVRGARPSGDREWA